MKRLLGLAVALVVAACSPLPPHGAPSGLTPMRAVPVSHADRASSWMAPSAKSAKELLYISDDSSGDVYVYDYVSGNEVGTLTGFKQPNGVCVDAIGDVWITDYGGGPVTEYAHGASKPLRKLSLGAFQMGCSIDPTTGDLAVTELYGVLAIFKNAKGRPQSHTSSSCPQFWSPGYDEKGNLYAESSVNFGTVVCELPHGGKKLRTVSSNMTISYPAGVMWDGAHLAFGDQSFGGHNFLSGMYRTRESASGDLTQVGQTELKDSGCGGESGVTQAFILGTKNTPENHKQGTAVISGNYICLGRVDIWAYPAGGNPKATLADPPPFPAGQAVSIKT